MRRVGGEEAIERGGGGVRREMISERTSSGMKGSGGMLVIERRRGNACMRCWCKDGRVGVFVEKGGDGLRGREGKG